MTLQKKTAPLVAMAIGVCLTLIFISGAEISAKDTTEVKTFTERTTEERILKELESIRSIQEENQRRMMDAVEHRSNNENDVSTEYGVMSNIEDNTRKDFLKDNWNAYGWLALLVSAFSFYYAIKTFNSQKQTEEHTQKAPIEAQIGVLKDLPRHFYRNLACTCAALMKFRSSANTRKGIRLSYPSEANMMKLMTLPDDFILPIDATDEKTYCKMHEEKLLLRNYNMEVKTAAEHFANNKISDNSLQNDYDNLLFKPIYLVSRMFELQDRIAIFKNNSSKPMQNSLWTSLKKKLAKPGIGENKDSYSEDNAPYAIYAFIKEHLEKVSFSTLASNGHNELEILKGIADDKVFISRIGVKNDSIDRSITKGLLKPDEDNDYKTSFLTFERQKDGGFNVKISRQEFQKFFNERYAEENKELKDTDKNKRKGIGRLEMILSGEEDTLKNLIAAEKPKNTPKDEDIDKCQTVLKPYFDAFQKDEWDVADIIYTILKVDTVLELNKIGMIEY